MEFEAFFLGLEPFTAIAVGIGAVVLAPVVGVVGEAIKKDPNLVESLSESAREATKGAIVWGIETLESAQTVFAEAEESFRDLVADAKAEHQAKKTTQERSEPREVEILSE